MMKILILLTLLSLNCFAYNRDIDYGDWQDYDGDCQNTRAEVLIARSLSPIEFTSPKNCTVKTGKWIDYYTSKIYTNAKDVQIDHLLSTHQHYETVGKYQSKAKRVEYYNNPENLVIANASLNMSKSDKDLSEFILRVPQENKCKYIRDYKRISDKNDISLDSSDMEVINQSPACFNGK